jgi:gamma-D-glutamyl-L-lysine dipeptidyl-peptidase
VPLSIILSGCAGPSGGAAAQTDTALAGRTASPTANYTATEMRRTTAFPRITVETPTLEITPGPPAYAVRIPKADVWDAPENENEHWSLQTQLILGEKVLVLDQAGAWSQIVAVEQPSRKDPRGYPGWVRSEFLIPGWPEAERFAVVMKSRSRIHTAPGGAELLIVTLDTRLPVESTDGDWVRVRLPDGTAGWLPAADVRLTDDLSRSVPADGIFALAESLVGVPYLWGGTTAGSLDCASLPYRLFHAYGILMSRDADDQALEGEFVGRHDVRKGDLIFVSESSGGKITHEVIYWGNNMVMDEDIQNGVMIRPISEFFVYYFWITARRFLP